MYLINLNYPSLPTLTVGLRQGIIYIQLCGIIIQFNLSFLSFMSIVQVFLSELCELIISIS